MGIDLEILQLADSTGIPASPVHIPDQRGGCFRTDLVVTRTPERTVKYVWWHADDPRPEPHNHPWEFRSTILAGGYSETSFTVVDGHLETSFNTYRTGDVNEVATGDYHVVYDVLPGTVTRLECGGTGNGETFGEWGYLNLDTLKHTAFSDMPTDAGMMPFRESLLALNPHLT